MENLKVAIGCDHGGFHLKEKIKEYMEVHHIEHKDFGIYIKEASDYPEVAKEVAKEFKELYTELIEQSSYGTYDNIIFIHMCSTHGISQANAAKARAQSYSSGGGGFSSGGGGGGSFGGGGGRRRFPLT